MNFNNFEPDVDWIEDIGIVGAVNWQQLGTGADFLFNKLIIFFHFCELSLKHSLKHPCL